MNSKSDKSKAHGIRLQYRLPVLFGVVTFLCFAFAYPRFVLGWAGLVIGAIVMLLAFAVLVYYPVSLIANWLHSRSVKSDPNYAKPTDGTARHSR